MWEVAYISDKGTVQETNDDRILVNKNIISSGKHKDVFEDSYIVVLCDGVGGEKYGNEAAEIVVHEFAKIHADQLNAKNIHHYVEQVNEKVTSAQRIDPEHAQMATTIAGVSINGYDFLVFNVGDTRVYRYRNPYISQLSTDHSLAHENNIIGVETKTDLKHVITHYIGGDRASAAVVDGTDSIGSDDMFLLCSDGVWEAVTDIELESILSKNISVDDMCQRIFDLAVENGSEDNISLVVMRRV